MPSAKMVAQNPGGNFSPLSLLGHAALLAGGRCAADWANDGETAADQTPNAATATVSCLHHRKKNSIG
jgi:hypothetical protein